MYFFNQIKTCLEKYCDGACCY